MNFPVVFVSYDMKFFKVFSVNVRVSPFKEIWLYADHVHVSDDCVYITTTMNHMILVTLIGNSGVPYEVMNVPSDKAVSIMANRIQFHPSLKAFCADNTSIAMFHLVYKFYEGCLRTGNIHLITQTLPQPQAQNPPMVQPQQVVETMPDLDIDQLVNDWAQEIPDMDPLDAFLDKFEFDDICFTDDVQDMDGIVNA